VISNDVINVQVEGEEDGNAEGIDTPKANDYLCAVHDVGDMLNLLLLHVNDHN